MGKIVQSTKTIAALHLHIAFARNNNRDSIARALTQVTRSRRARYPRKFSLEETNTDWRVVGRDGGWELNKNHANRRFGLRAAGNEMRTELTRSLGWSSDSACE